MSTHLMYIYQGGLWRWGKVSSQRPSERSRKRRTSISLGLISISFECIRTLNEINEDTRWAISPVVVVSGYHIWPTPTHFNPTILPESISEFPVTRHHYTHLNSPLLLLYFSLLIYQVSAVFRCQAKDIGALKKGSDAKQVKLVPLKEALALPLAFDHRQVRGWSSH